jgi:carbon monoxide dehydrogenase subunit G
MPGQVGVRRLIDPGAMESAHWYPLPDGRWVWSMRFEAPSAEGLRVHFDRFSVGNGRVWVLDGALGKTKFFGPYTGTGPLQSGEFWTEIVFSDTIEIEYVPENGSADRQAPFHVVSLSHLWDVHKLTSRAVAAADATTPNYSCFLDATCYPADQAAEAATLQLGLEQPSGEVEICSGTLIGTVSGSGLPYVLTAGHCISDAGTAASMVAFWNYQSSSCNGPAPGAGSLPQQTGGTLLSNSVVPFQLDYAFVKLSGLPGGIIATFSGWNRNAVATNEQVVSVSHPQGLPTKYALGIRNPSGDDDSSYDITFSTTGLTDKGSSGSGLFETDIPGALPLIGAASGAQFPVAETGSLTVCDIIPAGAPLQAYYTKFTAIYPYIATYLNDSVAPGGVTFTASPNPIPAAGQKTTLSWNAPGYSNLVIRINSPTGGAMTGKLGSSGSVMTGTWVTDGMQFFLVDVTTGASIASVVVHVNGSGGGGGTVTFTANPNPIPAAGEKTTLTWNAPGHSSLVIRINSPSGDTMTGKLGSSGSVTTGTWVTDGMQFFLVDLESDASLASVVVHVNGSGGGGGGGIVTLAANPNPIPAAGEKTTLTWNAPGHSSVAIRINSPTGAAMTGALGSEGSATTGTWVADGMRFFLVDLISGTSLASVEVHVGAGNIYYSNFGLDGSFSSTAWCVSGSAAIGCGPTVVREIAVPFTPNFTFTLHGISLPLSYSGGDNNATISLLADSGGLPGNTLDSWVVSNLPSDSPPPGTTTVLDTFNTMLQAGQQYWVEVQAFGDTLIQWYENGLGFTGGMENNGSGWQPLTGAGSLPAFSVTGLQ